MAPTQQKQSSLLYKERIAQFVSLSPAALATPLPALCTTIFSPLLLTYFTAAKGIVLAYEDVQLSASPPSRTPPAPKRRSKPHAQQHHQDSDISDSDSSDDSNTQADTQLLLRHVDEYAAPFLWASATFLVFRPARDARLTARLTHQARSHITLAYLNMFPVSVVAKDLPESWSWRADAGGQAGCWVIGGADGEEVQGGRELGVKIKDFDGRLDGKGRGKGFLRIEGVVLEGEE